DRMRALSVLLVLLLVSAIVVPGMAASGDKFETVKLDIVDAATIEERTPQFINDLKSKGCSEEEIAEAIVNYPCDDKYLDGWTEGDAKKLSEELRWTRIAHHQAEITSSEERSSNVRLDGQYQSSSGMYLIDSLYSGVNGRVHPGSMECSSDGTLYQYLTSHLGKETNGLPNWIEIGVQTVFWRPNEYILFSWDENAEGDARWEDYGILPEGGDRDYNFGIYVSPVYCSGQGYPYTLSWEGQVKRIGYVPWPKGDTNEFHEYFRNDPGTFSDVSTSYVWDSYVNYNEYSVWWNENLDSQVPHPTDVLQTLSDARATFYKPWWSHAYRVDTWMA
ncbi:hypothetical protein, partial [Methanogenium sp. MK-MG]|uniref:hypothetical protein n=1 Tax=Methanogenium sp. MK-MG TaxID=2599926 RepID=UPI001C20A506